MHPPTLTRLRWFFHHDGMPLSLYSVEQTVLVFISLPYTAFQFQFHLKSWCFGSRFTESVSGSRFRPCGVRSPDPDRDPDPRQVYIWKIFEKINRRQFLLFSQRHICFLNPKTGRSGSRRSLHPSFFVIFLGKILACLDPDPTKYLNLGVQRGSLINFVMNHRLRCLGTSK